MSSSISVEDKEQLIQASIEAKQNSYSPYSKFRVGAAFLTPDGRLIKGANIENASYGGTICAERTGIVKAVSDGVSKFSALAVVTYVLANPYLVCPPSDVHHTASRDVSSACSPCGMCRQVLREFCSNDMPIYLVPGDYPRPLKENEKSEDGYIEGGVRQTNLAELLPDSFGPEHLELPRK
ncbi:cytidine deaminase [Coprinellus micaceus]|uniref:Cytidine deaminase n=1 Tax=Coprinellus micaceus TaxID=71717 RepID=A0A4Y7SD04_COPMI|nr:cytidine deaminase [Coprinellus micaceus]